jgi:hypothetical protein
MARFVLALFLLVLCGSRLTSAHCIGDCNGNGVVTIDEIVRGVCLIICIEPPFPGEACPALDPENTGHVAVAAIVTAVNNALNGCPDAEQAEEAE